MKEYHWNWSFSLNKPFGNMPDFKTLNISSWIPFDLKNPFTTNWFGIIWKLYMITHIIVMHTCQYLLHHCQPVVTIWTRHCCIKTIGIIRLAYVKITLMGKKINIWQWLSSNTSDFLKMTSIFGSGWLTIWPSGITTSFGSTAYHFYIPQSGQSQFDFLPQILLL